MRAPPASLAFLAGVGFAALPSVGPFLALLALTTGRVQLQRADRWWWIAALLLGAPYALTGSPMAGLQATAQVLAVWLIFRAGSAARQSLDGTVAPRWVGAGLLVGLGIALLVGLQQVEGVRWGMALTALDALSWQSHPAIFGHSMLVMAALLAVVVPSERLRVLALAIGLVAVLASGAREAAFAWLIVAIGLRFVGRRSRLGTRIAEWSLIVLMVAVVSGAGVYVGLGRSGYLVDLVRVGDGPINLFRGSEVPAGDWWYQLGVDLSSTSVVVDGQERTGLVVRKQWTEPWSRLQQIVTLAPDSSYALSVAWLAPEGVRPGLDGWGQLPGAGRDSVVTATLSHDGRLLATASGGLLVLDSTLQTLPGGWLRGTVVFRYEGERPLTWYVGAVVDRSQATGATVTFAELQLVQAEAAVPYQPGVTDRGVVDLRSSRYPIWTDALEAITERPLLGWGPGGLPVAVQTLHPEEARIRPLAAHGHNLVLATWVEAGVVGLIGLLIVLVLLALRAVQQRDRAMAIVLGGVLLLNFFDATLQQGALIYPLAGVLGWRAVGRRREVAQAETGFGSAAMVRVALATADLAAAWVALLVAGTLLGLWGVAWPESLANRAVLYLTLAWPAMAWREGLYPGYGLAPVDELRRSVMAALQASLLVVLGSLLLQQVIGLPSGLVLLTGLLSLVTLPVARAVAKRLLRILRLWGRPVIVVGEEQEGAAVVRELARQPLLGLRPVAMFADGAPVGSHVMDVPVLGDVDEAPSYARENGLRHAIVALKGLDRERIQHGFTHQGRHAFLTVQYLPDLKGLPATGVVTTPIGHALGLEVRNALASPSNRAVKRGLDLVAVVVGGLLASPILLSIALAIVVDSRGPAIFGHERIGRDGRRFKTWKFRTMTRDAQERLQELLARDPVAREEWERSQKLQDDPRVTRVGRFLRKYSLDELPQLWNVLSGEMSLVGPRPIVEDEVAKYDTDFDLYAQVRPGMTGYWQVSGRSDTSYAYRVDLDSYYVRNWSVWLDLLIMLRTVQVVLTGRGAY